MASVVVALDLVDDAPTGVRVSVVGVSLDRLCIICDGLIVVALCLVGASTNIVGDRAVGSRLIWSLKDFRAGSDGRVRVTGLIALIPYALIGSESCSERHDEQQSRRLRRAVWHHRLLSAPGRWAGMCNNRSSTTFTETFGSLRAADPHASKCLFRNRYRSSVILSLVRICVTLSGR